jgi:CGNR zinc finger protein
MPVTKTTLPHALRIVCRYLNARVTPRNWRNVVLGPFRNTILPHGVEAPDNTPVFGVSSSAELEQILDEYRPFVRRVINVDRYDSPEAVKFCDAITRRAGLELQGLIFNRRTGLLTPIWKTKESSFSEMLYAYLVLALQEVPPRHLHECKSCGKFFLDASRRKMTFCSPRCRNTELVRRYRERHPKKYNKYQRQLMADRYAARKPHDED